MVMETVSVGLKLSQMGSLLATCTSLSAKMRHDCHYKPSHLWENLLQRILVPTINGQHPYACTCKKERMSSSSYLNSSHFIVKEQFC